MRVLYLVGTLNAGGLERFVTRISLHAKTQGNFEPMVCCLAQREGRFLAELEAADVPVYEAPAGWERSYRALLALRDLIRQIAPDIVHSQVNFSLVQQFIAVRWAGRGAFCVTERSCYQLHGLARWRRIAQFHFLRLRRVHYSANGQAVAIHLGRQVGVSPQTIPVLPNGVPLIPAAPDKRAEIRAHLNWTPADIGVGYIGRLIKDKRHELFLEVIYRLRQQGLPVKACLLGHGPQLEAIKQCIYELQLEDHIVVAGSVLNVEEYLQAFDIVALFSAREGMPNVILEAMAAAKAIVATAVGAIPELLQDGAIGLLVREATPDNLTQAMTKLVEDTAFRQLSGQRAQEWVQQAYSVEAALARLLHHYQEIG